MPPELAEHWDRNRLGFGPEAPPPPVRRFKYSRTRGCDTPSPADIGPMGIFGNPTGTIYLSERPEQVVSKALDHIRDMSMFAIDPEADERVDRLVASKMKGEEFKPLKRKV